MAPRTRLPSPARASPAPPLELLQGTLDMLILQTLQWGPRHGYGISQAIRAGSRELLRAETGSLYPALHRLERRGWIAGRWEVSENRQRTRLYRLTPTGKRQLSRERSQWERFTTAVAGLLQAPATAD